MSTPRNTSRRLIDESPLLVLPSLATILGLHEAIVLQQIHYWLQSSKHEHDGRRWLYNSYPDWAVQFPFLTVNQIRRAIEHLEDKGLLIVGNYNSKGFDRTKWYSIDYDVLDSLELPATPDDPSGKIASPSGIDARRQGTHARAVGTHAPATGIQAGPIPETNAETTTETNTRESAPAPVDIPTPVTGTTASRDMQPTGRAIKPVPIKQTALPAAYPLTDEMRVWAHMETPDLGDRLDTEHKKFCNHYRSKGERRADWRPAWETWMIRAVEEFAPKQQKGNPPNGRAYESPAERREREWAAALGSIGSPNGYQSEPEPEFATLPERTADARIISLNGRRVG